MNEIDIKEWLVLASHDADTADLLIKEKGHADIIIYFAVYNKFCRISKIVHKLI
ncbi:hypothetical protein HZC34_04390 [Candidatus Saganbacteria bacterium]|nr:hypothetical protein [Candidatus Saganbacteria bacterium]